MPNSIGDAVIPTRFAKASARFDESKTRRTRRVKAGIQARIL